MANKSDQINWLPIICDEMWTLHKVAANKWMIMNDGDDSMDENVHAREKHVIAFALYALAASAFLMLQNSPFLISLSLSISRLLFQSN